MNTFFWFFEARKDPQNAPLAIWMNGGPGASSLLGLLSENGPCLVNPDSNLTSLNPWSWNNEVNMLYLDQPTQAGFSYDTPHNVSFNLLTGNISDFTDKTPKQNSTFIYGTYGSGKRNRTAHGTEDAARAAWHFMQIWLQEFPGYHPHNSKVHLTAESYGGRYGPAFAAYFEEQNAKIRNSTLSTSSVHEAIIIDLESLLIVNGCIDRLVQVPSYIKMVSDNTYGIEALNETVVKNMTHSLERKHGCRDRILLCRELAAVSDPENLGVNRTGTSSCCHISLSLSLTRLPVNEVCHAAEKFCSTHLITPYRRHSGRNYYDIATLDPDPFPPPFFGGYLNQAHIQQALGVPVNWTRSSSVVNAAFSADGDYPRDGWLHKLQYLLSSGVRVALMYGDRDFACNWYGGEAVSLALNYSNFNGAGYADIETNASYTGGLVREHGNLSFSRVFEAGHEVPAYQPETAYRIFMRVLFGDDIATGSTKVDSEYSTKGLHDASGVKNDGIEQPLQFCYLLDYKTCTDEQFEAVGNGTAEVVEWIVKDRNSTTLFPELFKS